MSTKNRDSDIPNNDDAFEDYEELFFSKGTQSAEVVSKPVPKQKPNDGNDEEGIDSIAQGTIHILRNHLNQKSWKRKFQFLITTCSKKNIRYFFHCKWEI